ncbi:MAG: hypothetical protein ACOYEQ_05910 [Bacillota bacterium]
MYYPNENRVELLDEALPEDPITTVLEALDKRPLTNNQLPLRENTCFPLVVDRVPLERLSVQEGLMLLDGNREIGRLVNHRQKQQWSGQGPVALSTLIADCRPQDKVALIHSGDGQVYRLMLIIPLASADRSSTNYPKKSSLKKPKKPVAVRNQEPEPPTPALSARLPLETLLSLESWASAVSKSACEAAIDSQIDKFATELLDRFSEIVDSAFQSHMRSQATLQEELERKNQTIESLKVRTKHLEHSLKVTYDEALSDMSDNLSSASLILRAYSVPTVEPGTKLRELLQPLNRDGMLVDEQIETFIADINRMHDDLVNLARIFVDQKLMIPRKGDKDE